mmetsp:Transcript_19970/g.55086  ORF Transcript_19970/g.55086 Transcript_19970/m.55086 type:complete len:267 (-) Transcript_19970:1777-2577(-)
MQLVMMVPLMVTSLSFQTRVVWSSTSAVTSRTMNCAGSKHHPPMILRNIVRMKVLLRPDHTVYSRLFVWMAMLISVCLKMISTSVMRMVSRITQQCAKPQLDLPLNTSTKFSATMIVLTKKLHVTKPIIRSMQLPLMKQKIHSLVQAAWKITSSRFVKSRMSLLHTKTLKYQRVQNKWFLNLICLKLMNHSMLTSVWVTHGMTWLEHLATVFSIGHRQTSQIMQRLDISMRRKAGLFHPVTLTTMSQSQFLRQFTTPLDFCSLDFK